jgi:hypothetical protein
MRPPIGDRAMTAAERQRRRRAGLAAPQVRYRGEPRFQHELAGFLVDFEERFGPWWEEAGSKILKADKAVLMQGFADAQDDLMRLAGWVRGRWDRSGAVAKKRARRQKAG